MIFTFEGLDGVGKTTIANQVYETLNDYIKSRNAPYNIIRIKEPMPCGSTKEERIQSANDFRKDWQSFIRPDTIYLVDRSIDSTFAYQIAMDINWSSPPINQTIVRTEYEKYFKDIIQPNRTYWIRASNTDRAKWLKERGVDDADVYYEPHIVAIGFAYGQIYQAFDRVVRYNNADGTHLAPDIMVDMLEVLYESGKFEKLFDTVMDDPDESLQGWLNQTWMVHDGK